MVYDEYKDFMNEMASNGITMKMYKRGVALKAFEHLISIELVIPAEGTLKAQKEHRMMKIMLEPLQITEAVSGFKDCPTHVKQWANRLG